MHVGHQQPYRDRPPRLDKYFDAHPLFFVTANTWKRQDLLATRAVHETFKAYCQRGIDMSRVEVGRYVIMPNHLHLFVRGDAEFDLGVWMRGLKRAIGKLFPELSATGTLWQEGFLDHVLRHGESYEDKWGYMVLNPFRAGLVQRPEDWPYQGELVRIGWP
jgi:REP element-mobilizing transposase RayT